MAARGRSRRAARRERLRLLPRSAIVRTGTTQRADWNYHPVLGRVLRRRHALVVALLGDRPARRLLQLGYGSGSLLGVLAPRTEQLYGVDVHPAGGEVRRVLAAHGIPAALVRADAAALPFATSSIDCVVADSVLPYVADVDATCTELERVLDDGGRLVVVIPGDAGLLKAALRALTGVDPDSDLVTSPRDVRRTVLAHFPCERRLTAPAPWVPAPRLYTAFALRRAQRA